MYNLEFLHEHFCRRSIEVLKEIFDIASTIDEKNTKTKKELNESLHFVLKLETNPAYHKQEIFPLMWIISPNGDTHIVVIGNLCLLINIFGVKILFENRLFCEGELRLLNFHWIERDHLVIFDIHYMVPNTWKKCICHFDNSDFFAYFTDESKR